MSTYSKANIKSFLERESVEAQRRLAEVKARHKGAAGYEILHDAELARLWFHDSLVSSAYLETRSTLLAELEDRLAPGKYVDTRAFSREHFERERIGYVRRLISIVEKTTDES